MIFVSTASQISSSYIGYEGLKTAEPSPFGVSTEELPGWFMPLSIILLIIIVGVIVTLIYCKYTSGKSDAVQEAPAADV